MIVKINNEVYEIVYSYYPPRSKTSASMIAVPVLLRKID